MNLLELKKLVNTAIENAKDANEDPESVPVYIQIDGPGIEEMFSADIELAYDNNICASGCVIHGWKEDMKMKNEIGMRVRVFFKHHTKHDFVVDNIGEAREMAKRICTEGVWIEKKNEELFFPAHRVFKCKILK